MCFTQIFKICKEEAYSYICLNYFNLRTWKNLLESFAIL